MPSRINKILLNHYVQVFRGVSGLISIGYPKMGVIATHKLRGRLAEKGCQLLFIKNRIAHLALRELGGGPDVKELTRQQSAWVWGGDDPVALARLLADNQKEFPEMTIHGAWVDGVVLGADAAKELAKSPSRAELLSRLAGLLLSPAGKVLSAIGSPAANLAGQIKAHAENLEKPAGAA